MLIQKMNVTFQVLVTFSGRGYTISVYYVDKLTSNDLLKRLKNKGMRNSDYTRAVIKDKLNDTDSEIATTSCKVSLACPLGKRNTPLISSGRRTRCKNHLYCQLGKGRMACTIIDPNNIIFVHKFCE